MRFFFQSVIAIRFHPRYPKYKKNSYKRGTHGHKLS